MNVSTAFSYPLVSIITTSYQQGDFLEETIQSVLSQTYPNIEYIIVDGGSSDGSVEIIQKYADRLAWWVSERDRGQTDAINKGFARAKGEILAWLCSDDLYKPETVAEAVSFLQKNPDVAMVYGDANYIDEKGNVIGKYHARQTDYKRLLQGHVNIAQPSAFWRTDIWQKVGPLDIEIRNGMDYDLWVRISKIAPILYVPRLWADYRLHIGARWAHEFNPFWPYMLRVYFREGGGWFSWLVFQSLYRPYWDSLLPLPRRLEIRKRIAKLKARIGFA